MADVRCNPQVALAMAIGRIEESLERAEEELPKLAAPDGTVAVDITDLRALLDEHDKMMLDFALANQEWSAGWYGSEPQRGSTLWALAEHGGRSHQIAYFGDAEGVHEKVSKIASLHNASLGRKPQFENAK